jgi:hypothetical protein
VSKKKPTYELLDHNTVSPEALNISADMRNGDRLAEWFVRVQLYIEAMTDLGRVTFIHLDQEERMVYVSSHPSDIADA